MRFGNYVPAKQVFLNYVLQELSITYCPLIGENRPHSFWTVFEQNVSFLAIVLDRNRMMSGSGC